MSSTDTISSSSSRQSRPSHRNNTETKAGRTYLDPASSSVPYPLPIDLAETHRQIIFAQLTSMIYDTPILSKDLLQRPPLRVLELGCDTGWWSATCHQYFDARGHQVEFVGLDIKTPLGLENYYEQLGMDWAYVQHDLNDTPWPFEDGAFDLIMARNLALTLDPRNYSKIMHEYARVVKKGGTVEIWEQDMTVRSMRPKIQDHAGELDVLGLYPVSDNGEFGPATNHFAVQLNKWMAVGMASLPLPIVPCSYIQSMFEGHLVDGSEAFDVVKAKRVAIPLNGKATDWETTKDDEPRVLSENQMVVRRTALETYISMVEALEPCVRSASGKDQSSWDSWLSKAKRNWLEDDGLEFGECLELGVWSVVKNC